MCRDHARREPDAGVVAALGVQGIMRLVSRHLRRHRGWLAVSYSLTVVENVFELLYPFAIGLAVDGLLDDRWSGVAVLVAITLAHIVVGAGRQVFDTRSFNRLYADLASELVERQRSGSVATSSVAARTVLAGEYVEFLERDVGAAIAAAFAVFGSLLMLFLYDPVVGLAAALLLLPVGLVNLWLMRRSGRIYRRLNDLSENEVSAIERGRTREVRRHFRLLAAHWNRLSDSEAISWVVVELLAVGVVVITLVRATDGGGEVGAVFAMIAYVWFYTAGLDTVPAVVQRMSNLPDIRRRLDLAASMSPDAAP
jgi:ABC-type multidrug transport system fused ATPase/permease subunit